MNKNALSPAEQILYLENMLAFVDNQLAVSKSELAQAHAEAAGIREALLEAIIPLEALLLSHGDQFGPEMVTAIETARRLTLAIPDAGKSLLGELTALQQLRETAERFRTAHERVLRVLDDETMSAQQEVLKALYANLDALAAYDASKGVSGGGT